MIVHWAEASILYASLIGLLSFKSEGGDYYFLVLLKELPTIDAYLVPPVQMETRAKAHSHDWPSVNPRQL